MKQQGEDLRMAPPDQVGQHLIDRLKSVILPFVVFQVLTLGLYWVAIDSPLQFDDFTVIRGISEENPWNRCTSPRRIVTAVTFTFNHLIHQKDTFGYHLVNCIIHGLAGLGLYVLVHQFPLKQERRRRLAWAASLIFAVHPLATQSVTYISQRYSTMAGMFALWALAAYARGRKPNGWPWLIGSGVLALLALFCKEYVGGLLLMAILMDVILFAPSASIGKKAYYTALVRASVLLPATLLFLSLYYVSAPRTQPTKAQPAEVMGRGGDLEYSFADWGGKTVGRAEYMRTQWKIIPTVYFRLLLVPVGQSVDHPFDRSRSWKDLEAWVWAVALTLFLGGALVFHRKWPIPAFGVVIIFVSLGPTSTLVPNTEFVGEQRAYLAIAGFALIIATILSTLRGTTFCWILSIYLVCLGSLTVYRNTLWNSNLALWQDAAYQNSQSPRIFNTIGSIYMRQNRYQDAEEQFRNALDAEPKYLPSLYSLPFALFMQGKYDEAISGFIWRLRKEPENVEVIHTLGRAFLLKGELRRARITVNEALKLDPAHINASLTMLEILIKAEDYNTAERLGMDILKRPLKPWQQTLVRRQLETIRNNRPLKEVPDHRPEPVPVP